MEEDDGIRLLLSKNDDRYQLEMPLEKVTTVSLWNGVFKKVKSSWFSRGTLQEVHIFNLCRWQCESKKWIKEADSRKCPGKQCARSSPYLESVIRIKTQLYCMPASSFYIHESEMTGQTLFVLLLQTVFAPEMLLPQCQEISPCELDILGG